MVLSLVADVGAWRGTAGELLEELNMRAGEYCQLERWLRTPRALSGALKRLAPNLRACGVEVKTLPRTTNGRRIIALEKSPAAPVCSRP